MIAASRAVYHVPAMSSPSFSDPPEGFVQAAEACRLLGISDRTLRRRVQAGTVEGEYIPRPQGTVLYVKLPPELEQAAGDAAQDAAPSSDASSEGPQAAQETRQDAAIVAALLERLDGKDAALLAATERAVRAETALDAARETADDLRRRLEAAEREAERLARRGWWWRLLNR